MALTLHPRHHYALVWVVWRPMFLGVASLAAGVAALSAAIGQKMFHESLYTVGVLYALLGASYLTEGVCVSLVVAFLENTVRLGKKPRHVRCRRCTLNASLARRICELIFLWGSPVVLLLHQIQYIRYPHNHDRMVEAGAWALVSSGFVVLLVTLLRQLFRSFRSYLALKRNSERPMVRIMQFNVSNCTDRRGVFSPALVAKVIREGADIVAVQEIERTKANPRGGSSTRAFDQVRQAAIAMPNCASLQYNHSSVLVCACVCCFPGFGIGAIHRHARLLCSQSHL